MEKSRPHYSLSEIHACLKAGKVRATQVALRGAAHLKMGFPAMCREIATLTMQDFYKSMTNYADSHIWQDVYHKNTVSGDVYLKLSIADGLLIISFKEL